MRFHKYKLYHSRYLHYAVGDCTASKRWRLLRGHWWFSLSTPMFHIRIGRIT